MSGLSYEPLDNRSVTIIVTSISESSYIATLNLPMVPNGRGGGEKNREKIEG